LDQCFIPDRPRFFTGSGQVNPFFILFKLGPVQTHGWSGAESTHGWSGAESTHGWSGAESTYQVNSDFITRIIIILLILTLNIN
jgi:hypothetical protein